MVLLSTCAYLMVYFIPHGLITVALLAIFGYLLSLDLGGLGWHICNKCLGSKFNDTEQNENGGFMWKWGIKEMLYHAVMLIFVISVALLLNKYVASDDPTLAADLVEYLAYAVMALLAIEVILSECQSVYVLLGFCRNKLYPSSVQRTTIFRKGKTKLNVLGFVRRTAMNWGKAKNFGSFPHFRSGSYSAVVPRKMFRFV